MSAHCLSPAGSASPPPVPVDEKIVSRKRVILWAMRFYRVMKPTWFQFAVLFDSHGNQMRRVTAGLIFALVMDLMLRWNGANAKLVKHAMGVMPFRANRHTAITGAVLHAKPLPAARHWIHADLQSNSIK